MLENFDFEIKSSLKKALVEMGFEKPTEIQEKAIPLILDGLDVIGKSQTGSGKTVAFGIPAIQCVDGNKKNTQILVVCPTRELAVQATNEIRKLTRFTNGVKTIAVYGGQPIARQIPLLRQGAHIVVGTPGRILDHLRRKTIKLSNIKMVVLDEADEMLNMGFRDDIEDILDTMPKERQTILFSATMPKEIMDIVNNYQKDPVLVEVESKQMTVDAIKQYYINCKRGRKNDTLVAFLREKNIDLSIVFTNTKKMVDELVEQLNDKGIKAKGLHGDMRQRERDKVMKDFRGSKKFVLVATDVAARGIDVNDIQAVVNYDVPQQTEYYVHRIGRTARAGKEGISVTFLQGRRQKGLLDDIIKLTKSDITPLSLETIEDDNQAIINDTSSQRNRGQNRQRNSKDNRNNRDRKPRENRDFKDRKPREDNGFADRKPREDRNFTDRKPREDRNFADRKPREDRDFTDRKPREDRDFADRKPREDRDFADRKPREDRNFKENKDTRRNKFDDKGKKEDKFYNKSKSYKNTQLEESYTMRLSIGRKQGATPNNILGAVAGESRIDSKLVGSISIKDNYALVDIPKNIQEKVVRAVNGTKIAGKKIQAQ